MFLALFVSCKEDNPPEPPAATMTILEAPTFLAANVDSCYTYRVQLQNSDADSVTVEVRFNNSVHSMFALYDDGGAGSSFPDYACSGSGDIVPNNRQYTRRINARSLADSVTGSYEFRFHAPQIEEQRLTVHVENVSACLMTQWPQVDTFEMCFNTTTFEVRVSASDQDIVDSVRVKLCDPTSACEELAAFHPVSGDTLWRLTVTPNLFRCGQHAGAGYYTLVYEAVTRFGQSCSQSVSVQQLANQFPVLANLDVPRDTVYRPLTPGHPDTLYVTVRLNDCELAGDTSFIGLRFDVSRDDTVHWGTDASFFLSDKGRNGDAVAGDQIYTAGLLTDTSTVHLDNEYYLRFYAVEGMVLSPNGTSWACDAFHDTSAFVYDSVRIIRPPGLLTRTGTETALVGPEFHVVN